MLDSASRTRVQTYADLRKTWEIPLEELRKREQAVIVDVKLVELRLVRGQPKVQAERVELIKRDSAVAVDVDQPPDVDKSSAPDLRYCCSR